jgi:quercetin dioxygenase-like cupin family protein
VPSGADAIHVRAGEVGFQVAGSERAVRANEGVVEVPAGTVHDWRNELLLSDRFER